MTSGAGSINACEMGSGKKLRLHGHDVLVEVCLLLHVVYRIPQRFAESVPAGLEPEETIHRCQLV